MPFVAASFYTSNSLEVANGCTVLESLLTREKAGHLRIFRRVSFGLISHKLVHVAQYQMAQKPLWVERSKLPFW